MGIVTTRAGDDVFDETAVDGNDDDDDDNDDDGVGGLVCMWTSSDGEMVEVVRAEENPRGLDFLTCRTIRAATWRASHLQRWISA